MLLLIRVLCEGKAPTAGMRDLLVRPCARAKRVAILLSHPRGLYTVDHADSGRWVHVPSAGAYSIHGFAITNFLHHQFST